MSLCNSTILLNSNNSSLDNFTVLSDFTSVTKPPITSELVEVSATEFKEIRERKAIITTEILFINFLPCSCVCSIISEFQKLNFRNVP